MSRISASPSSTCGSRVLGASKRGNRSPALVESQAQNSTRDADALSKERRVSLNSKQTLQFLNRAAATEKLRTAEPARRLKGDRLYAGPTVRMATNWEARFDSPGPQAYNEGDKWRTRFRNVPYACIDIARCARHMAVPTKPGPGDYNIAHHSVGDNPGGLKFGGLAPGKKYPPRTPDHPRAEIPCSYAEPDHVSCLQHQSTSNRTTSPTVFFGGAPRFQETPKSRGMGQERSPASTSVPKSTSKEGLKAPTTRPVTAAVHTSSAAASSRRGKKRKKRRRGGPRVFGRGDYGWLTSCVESKPWEPKLRLLDGSRSSCDGNEHGERPSISTLDASRSRSLTEKNAPRPVLRRGERYNQSEYNPQHRDLPREKDRYPGPKYDPPPGAFGRTGGGGGTAAPSASVSSLDRFPRGRLFLEEEVREREATPGPEAYDVGLEHRLEEHSLEMMQGSLKILESWGSLRVDRADDWPFAGRSGGDRASEFSRDGKVQKVWSSQARDEGDQETPSEGAENGREEEKTKSETELLEGVAKRTLFGRSRTPCLAGGSAAPEVPQTSKREASTMNASANQTDCYHRTAERRPCSRLSPASSAAARRGVPCSECLGVEVATAVNSFVAAAASVSDGNLFRRARTTGASVRFGDMPRQPSAPSFSIGRGQRDVASRLLHTNPAETVYKQTRLGRSGKGPTTAYPRAGDALIRPRPMAARVILPSTRGGGSSGPPRSGDGHSGVGAAAGGEAAVEGLVVVDGALGPQVRSCRPTSPSFTLAGPRRAATLFNERLRYGGQVLSPEQEKPTSREFFDAHIPTTTTEASVK